MYQTDATAADCLIWFRANPEETIGRPTPHFVVDVFSRAYRWKSYTGLENPSGRWQVAPPVHRWLIAGLPKRRPWSDGRHNDDVADATITGEPYRDKGEIPGTACRSAQ